MTVGDDPDATFKAHDPDEERDDDLVFLADLSIAGIANKLEERFRKDEIYTAIGPVLVSCNPFKPLPLYGDDMVALYSDAEAEDKAERPPHIFKVADNAFRLMLAEDHKQCVIISGESGAGKTEASKAIMQYISNISGTGGNDQAVDRLKNIVLDSNPMLEAFGNAMTLRNNNSSRFGKYFTLLFSPSNGGTPLGGGIQNYLLEKSRIVCPGKGERNYHIFYQMLSSTALCGELGLNTDPSSYRILRTSGTYEIDNSGGRVDDAEEFTFTLSSMETMGLDAETQRQFFELVAAVLHLGNIDFKAASINGAEGSSLDDPVQGVNMACALLGIEPEKLKAALLSRTMNVVGTESYQVPNNPVQARLARDALAKDLYSRLFNLLVTKVNLALQAVGGATRISMKRQRSKTNKGGGKSDLSIGVLDIFGFEIFDKNLFEQLCINFVNERMQQCFIQLTIKSEQEDYAKEDIPWIDVPFFDNAVVIELIQGKTPSGVFACLDDTSKVAHAQDGREVDEKFLDNVTKNAKGHAHFKSRQGRFTIMHYAGEVEYDVSGFIDSNKDTVNQDLLVLVKSSTADFVSSTLYPEVVDTNNRARSGGPSLSSKLKKATDELVDTLMACTPHYVRCIKSNDVKCADQFEVDRVTHQVKYLGLLENIKVRRAGYAFRLDFAAFNARFKLLLGNAPAGGDAKSVTQAIIAASSNRIPDLTAENEIKYGKKKVFIRRPETYFALQESRKRMLKRAGLAGADGEWVEGMDLDDMPDREVVLSNLLECFVGLNVEDAQLCEQIDKLMTAGETPQFTETFDRKNAATGNMEEVLLAVTSVALYLAEVIAKQPDKASTRAWIEEGGRWIRNPNPTPQVTYTLKLIRRAEIAQVSATQTRQMADNLLMITFKSDGVKIGLLMNAGQSFATARDQPGPVSEADRQSVKDMARPQTNLMWRISTNINRQSARPMSMRPMSIRPGSVNLAGAVSGGRAASVRPVSMRPVSMRPQSMRPQSMRPTSMQPVAEDRDAADPKLQKYVTMKQLGIPFGAIRNTMTMDGVEVPDGFLAPAGFDDDAPF